MEYRCSLRLVTSSELVVLQPRLACEALHTGSKCIVDTDPRGGENGTYHWV
jgi:hypothetical protein